MQHFSQPLNAVISIKAGQRALIRYSELNVSVWSYDIPHEDVVFATNSSAIDGAEVYKLESALVEARKVVAKYDGEVKVREDSPKQGRLL